MDGWYMSVACTKLLRASMSPLPTCLQVCKLKVFLSMLLCDGALLGWDECFIDTYFCFGTRLSPNNINLHIYAWLDKYSIHLGPFMDDAFEACHKHHLRDEMSILGKLEVHLREFCGMISAPTRKFLITSCTLWLWGILQRMDILIAQPHFVLVQQQENALYVNHQLRHEITNCMHVYLYTYWHLSFFVYPRCE